MLSEAFEIQAYLLSRQAIRIALFILINIFLYMHPVDRLKKYLNAGAFSQIAISLTAILTVNIDKVSSLMSPFVMKMSLVATQLKYGPPYDTGIIAKYGAPAPITPTATIMPAPPSTYPVMPDNFMHGFMPVITPTQHAYLDPNSHIMPLFNNWWNIFSGNQGFGITTPEGLSSMLGLVASFALPLWAMLGWVFWGSVWYYKTKDKK